MCRTKFMLLAPDSINAGPIAFFVTMPARVQLGDTVAVWPLLPVEMAADKALDWLQGAGHFDVYSLFWSRDEQGIFLAAILLLKGQ